MGADQVQLGPYGRLEGERQTARRARQRAMALSFHSALRKTSLLAVSMLCATYMRRPANSCHHCGMCHRGRCSAEKQAVGHASDAR